MKRKTKNLISLSLVVLTLMLSCVYFGCSKNNTLRIYSSSGGKIISEELGIIQTKEVIYFNDAKHLKLTAEPNTNYQFLYWMLDNAVYSDNIELDIVLKKETTIKAVFAKDSSYVITYVDENNKIISSELINPGEQISHIPYFPNRNEYEATFWCENTKILPASIYSYYKNQIFKLRWTKQIFHLSYDISTDWQLILLNGYSFDVEYGDSIKFQIDVLVPNLSIEVYYNSIKINPLGNVYTISNITNSSKIFVITI